MLEGPVLRLDNYRLDQPKAMDPYALPSRMEQTGHASSSVMVIPRTQACLRALSTFTIEQEGPLPLSAGHSNGISSKMSFIQLWIFLNLQKGFDPFDQPTAFLHPPLLSTL